MKSLKLGVLFVAMILVLSTVSASAAGSNSNDKEINVKVGDLFILKLSEVQKKEGCQYYWIPAFDETYLKIFTDYYMEENVFKALKKGKTTITMELFEIDSEDNTNLIKTEEYFVTIK